MAFMDRLLLEALGNSFKEVQTLEEMHIIKTASVVNHTRQTLTISAALDSVAVQLRAGWHRAQMSPATPPQY